MKLLPRFSAVILDMDGLIVDTESTYFSAWQQAASHLGYNLSNSFCAGLSGVAFPVIEQKLKMLWGNDFPFSEFYALSSTFWRAQVEMQGISVKKGVCELLSVLQQQEISYCLATNSPEINARECLAYARIDHLFPHVVARDHVQHPKPAGDLFRKAATILQQPIEACIVVEDSLVGLLAAQNAKAFSVLVPSMSVDNQMQALAHLILNDLSELAELVQCQINN